jgi:hypothetical protein
VGRTRPRLSPERLSRIASAAFGRRWQAHLAECMGVRRRTVVTWASGDLPVSAKSEAIIIALCVARCRANLAEALKVRREVATLAKTRAARAASRIGQPEKPAPLPWWKARGQTWHEARGLPEPAPKPPKQPKRKPPGKLRPYKKRQAKKAPSPAQLAYWASEAVRENGRKGLAKGRAVRLGEPRPEPMHNNDSSSDALSHAAEAGPGQVEPSS